MYFFIYLFQNPIIDYQSRDNEVNNNLSVFISKWTKQFGCRAHHRYGPRDQTEA